LVILLFALSVASGNSPAHDGDAIGRRRHLGHGPRHQPKRGSRSPPIHLVSQLSDRSICPSACPSKRPGVPAAVHARFGRVIDRVVMSLRDPWREHLGGWNAAGAGEARHRPPDRPASWSAVAAAAPRLAVDRRPARPRDARAGGRPGRARLRPRDSLGAVPPASSLTLAARHSVRPRRDGPLCKPPA
jgi:hypothetical protein